MEAVSLFIYNREEYKELDYVPEGRINERKDNNTVWSNVNINGPKEEIEAIFKRINTHPLVIKGILDPTKRPKIQDLGDAVLLQVNSVNINTDDHQYLNLIKFILGKNFLVTFLETSDDPFDSVRDKIRNGKGIIREKGPDFLLYRLLEAIIDNYFDKLDELQSHKGLTNRVEKDWKPTPESMQKIEKMNQRLFDVKKSIRPLIESVTILERGLSDLIQDNNRKYFLDLQQQCQFFIDSLESYEHRLESSINLFFTMQGHHMNQVMKTLTVISSIFIPLTFLAGIYGMNFANMPELDMKYGYYLILSLMSATVIGMLIFLKRRKWF